jgi:hypothetical protein
MGIKNRIHRFLKDLLFTNGTKNLHPRLGYIFVKSYVKYPPFR